MSIPFEHDITMRDLQEMGIAVPHKEPEIELLDALDWLSEQSSPYAKRVIKHIIMLHADNQRLLAKDVVCTTK